MGYMLSVNKSVASPITIPIMVFTFDDGYIDNDIITKDIFISRGKTYTQYLQTGLSTYLTVDNKLSDAQVNELIAAGIDIQCHTNSHPNLTTLTEAQILAEYDAVNAYFAARGWALPKHTAYPGYATDANVKAYTAAKRLSGRFRGNTRFDETVDWFAIPSYSINIAKNDATALAAIKTAMDTLATTKLCITVNGHRVYNDADAEPLAGNSIQKSYLEDIVDYAETKGILVLTISQLYDKLIKLKVTV